MKNLIAMKKQFSVSVLMISLVYSNYEVTAQCSDISSFVLTLSPSSCPSSCEFDVRISNHSIDGAMWLYSVEWFKIGPQGMQTAIVDNGPSDGIEFNSLPLIPYGDLEKGILKIFLNTTTKIGARILKKDINGQVICSTPIYSVDAHVLNSPPPSPPNPVLEQATVYSCFYDVEFEQDRFFRVTNLPPGKTCRWFERNADGLIIHEITGNETGQPYFFGGAGRSELHIRINRLPNVIYPSQGTTVYRTYGVSVENSATTVGSFVLAATPNVLAGPSIQTCFNSDPFPLSGSPVGGNWIGLGVQNGNIFNPSAAGEGQKYLVYEYADPVTGCSSTDYKGILVKALPVPPITSDKTANFSSPVTLSATGATGFEHFRWYSADQTYLGTGSTYETQIIVEEIVYYVTKFSTQTYCESNSVPIRITVRYNNYNYVGEDLVKVPGVKNADDVEFLSIEEKNTVVNYFDGLGRPVQTVHWQSSPKLKQDIVQPMEYDDFGRQSTTYLPYVASETNAWYKLIALKKDHSYQGSDHEYFYSATPEDIAGDLQPYARTVFEASPINRVIKQGSPGAIWQPDATEDYSSNDHTIKHSYGTNTTGEVRHWTYSLPTVTSPQGSLTFDFYSQNQLYKTKTKDEHQNEVIQYTDKEGRVVLKKIQASSTEWAETYYVYDDVGNLVIVLPPEAVKALIGQ